MSSPIVDVVAPEPNPAVVTAIQNECMELIAETRALCEQKCPMLVSLLGQYPNIQAIWTPLLARLQQVAKENPMASTSPKMNMGSVLLWSGSFLSVRKEEEHHPWIYPSDFPRPSDLGPPAPPSKKKLAGKGQDGKDGKGKGMGMGKGKGKGAEVPGPVQGYGPAKGAKGKGKARSAPYGAPVHVQQEKSYNGAPMMHARMVEVPPNVEVHLVDQRTGQVYATA